jgi:transcriptional regulator with XRE-family HTH domain
MCLVISNGVSLFEASWPHPSALSLDVVYDRPNRPRSVDMVTSSRPRPSPHQPDLRSLGAAIKRARTGAGLSLRELAARCDSSAPFLSQVERGHAAPSLAMLIRIASALDTTTAALLTGPPTGKVSIVRSNERPAYSFDESANPASVEVLSPDGHVFTATHYTVERGQDLGGYLARDGEEMIHVLTGRLRIDLAGHGLHELGPGDTIHYSSSIPHRWIHLGRACTRFLHVVTT